jgi:hypothetical protein
MLCVHLFAVAWEIDVICLGKNLTVLLPQRNFQEGIGNTTTNF